MIIQSKNTLSSIDDELAKLKETKEFSFHFYQFAENLINECLLGKEYENLFHLLPYFEEPEKYPLLTHSADTLRIYTILQITQLEIKFNKKLYVSSANSFSSLMTQYYNTIFCLRRVELHFSGALLADALQYLSEIPFDIYAAELILNSEAFENYDQLYSDLLNHFSNIWSIQDRISWCSMWSEKSASDLVYMNQSSLFLELNDLRAAYTVLTQIKNPSAETKEFILYLKDVVENEPK